MVLQALLPVTANAKNAERRLRMAAFGSPLSRITWIGVAGGCRLLDVGPVGGT